MPGSSGGPPLVGSGAAPGATSSHAGAHERAAEVERANLLAAASARLAASLDEQTTLQAIAECVVPAVADWCRIDLIDAAGVLRHGLTHHDDAAQARAAVELTETLQCSVDMPGSMASVIATGRPYFVRLNPPSGLDHERDRAFLTIAHTLGLRSYFIVPLIARGRTIGALAALQAESGRELSDEDRALVIDLGHRAALALANARLYAEAQTARAQAAHANRMKDDFLAMLGHELRNPLAPIVNALHLMRMHGDAVLTDERRIIERQVVNLSRLVDDLLDVTRIAKGKLTVRRERVQLQGVIAQALELVQPVLGDRTQAIEIDLPATPLFVVGDAVRLAQTVANLLSNAGKFTPATGRIALSVRAAALPAAAAGEPPREVAEIEVTDTGSGITPELLPHVFDVFTQGHPKRDHYAAGLGLGLAIVKHVVQLHEGSVSAHSDGTDRGSTFVVRLPRAPDAPPRTVRREFTAAAQAAGRILVVDDDADAAETLARLLQLEGYTVCTAADGTAALEVMQTFEADLAVLDIGLPDMDGYNLARTLRAGPRGARLAIVALTGYGREHDRSRALAAGFDEHLVKPVSVEYLLRMLASRLAARKQGAPGPTP
jgi:signal transduction histidine kinase/CheY-like chemotaxis protein